MSLRGESCPIELQRSRVPSKLCSVTLLALVALGKLIWPIIYVNNFHFIGPGMGNFRKFCVGGNLWNSKEILRKLFRKCALKTIC